MKSVTIKAKLHVQEEPSTQGTLAPTDIRFLRLEALEENGQVLISDYDQLVTEIKSKLDPSVVFGTVSFLTPEGVSIAVVNSADLVTVLNDFHKFPKRFQVITKKADDRVLTRAMKARLSLEKPEVKEVESAAQLKEEKEARSPERVERLTNAFVKGKGSPTRSVASSCSSRKDDVVSKLQLKIKSLQETLQSATEFARASRDEASKYKSEYEKLENELKQLDLANRELRVKNLELQASLDKTLSGAVRARDAEIVELKLRIAELETCNELLRQQAESAKSFVDVVETQKDVFAEALESMRTKMIVEMRESLSDQQTRIKTSFSAMLDPLACQISEEVSRFRECVSKDVEALRHSVNEVKEMHSSRLVTFAPQLSTKEEDPEFEDDHEEDVDDSPVLINYEDLNEQKFSAQVEKLKSLGFTNSSLNSFLLEMHKGDVDAVIQYLKSSEKEL